MDRLESNNPHTEKNAIKIALPKRRFTIEFIVGIFTIAGVTAAGMLAVGLAGEQLFSGGLTTVYAEFDNISGLGKGASVEIAGVPVGKVTNIELGRGTVAVVSLRLHEGIELRDDDIASIRTKGIIGDRYVKISRGGSDIIIPDGGRMTETESVVDIEDIIGKIVHSLTGEKEKDKPKEEEGKAEAKK